jgi:hypothetical protein
MAHKQIDKSFSCTSWLNGLIALGLSLMLGACGGGGAGDGGNAAPLQQRKTVQSAAGDGAPSRLPMYELSKVAITDHFYTTDAAQRSAAVAVGFVDLGVAFYVDASGVAGAAPFQR